MIAGMMEIGRNVVSLVSGAGVALAAVYLVAVSVKKLTATGKSTSFSGLIGRLAVSGVAIILILKYLQPDIPWFLTGFSIGYFLTVWIMSIQFFRG